MCVCVCVSCAQKKVSSEECLVFSFSLSLSRSLSLHPFFFRERESRESFSRSVVLVEYSARRAFFFLRNVKEDVSRLGIEEREKILQRIPSRTYA